MYSIRSTSYTLNLQAGPDRDSICDAMASTICTSSPRCTWCKHFGWILGAKYHHQSCVVVVVDVVDVTVVVVAVAVVVVVNVMVVVVSVRVVAVLVVNVFVVAEVVVVVVVVDVLVSVVDVTASTRAFSASISASENTLLSTDGGVHHGGLLSNAGTHGGSVLQTPLTNLSRTLHDNELSLHKATIGSSQDKPV